VLLDSPETYVNPYTLTFYQLMKLLKVAKSEDVRNYILKHITCGNRTGEVK